MVRRWIKRTLMGLGIAATLTSCTPQGGDRGGVDGAYNSNSGGDERRDMARRLFLGTSEDDSCDAGDGDNTDWRQVLIREPGVLTVTLAVDSPGQLEAELLLHDNFGRPIDRVRVNGTSDFYRFQALPVDMGRYYIQLDCKRGASVYTIAARFDTDVPVDQRLSDRPIAQFEDPKTSPVRPGGGTSTDDSPDPNDPLDLGIVGLDASEIQPDLPVAREPVIGTIILATPVQGDEGKLTVTLRGVGFDQGVEKGMIGTMMGLDERQVELFKCEPKRCFGVVTATREEIEANRQVRFIFETD